MPIRVSAGDSEFFRAAADNVLHAPGRGGRKPYALAGLLQ